MIKTISFCNQCPCMGVDTEPGVTYCGLSSLFNEECVIDNGSEDYINQYNDIDLEYLIPPAWCRLRQHDVSLELSKDDPQVAKIRFDNERRIQEKSSSLKLLENFRIVQEENKKTDSEKAKEWDKKTDDMIDQILKDL